MMSTTTSQAMRVMDTQRLPAVRWPCKTAGEKLGGLVADGLYAWLAVRANIVLYSKRLGSVVSSRTFGDNKDKSFTITDVKELNYGQGKLHLLLVGCSLKSTGLVYVCRLPALTTIRCIALPNPVTYITTIKNDELFYDADQLCDELKIMSTVLLVGMATGQVYAVDLRHRHIEHQLDNNEIVVNESRPSQLFVIRKNEDCQEVKEMSDDRDCHLAMFINENFHDYCKYNGKLRMSVTSVLYVEETNTVAIGYSSGHLQLRDCKTMRTIYVLREPQCSMPVTHIGFIEPSDDPNNLCYLWVVQSDNVRLPLATMMALIFEQRVITPNGRSAYRAYQGHGVKLEMSLQRETGSGRCVSALSVCNVNMAKNETDMDEDCEIRLFAMLMEIRQNGSPKSYMFLFDINQWYKAQMPPIISHLKVSNSYASFVQLPHNDARHLDFIIAPKTLRPFCTNFRDGVEELYYPSSIYFEYDCLLDTELVRLKHAGVQQQILDRLVEKNWKLLINPSLVFGQCLQAHLTPFFWDKPDDYVDYSLPDQRSFVVSVLVENKMMSVLSACAEQWKNGTYGTTEVTVLHLVQCLWNHVMIVKQFADKLCVPLFDYSGTQMDGKNKRVLKYCLSQMQCVKIFLQDLHSKYGVHTITYNNSNNNNKSDYIHRVYTLNLVTQYFKAVTCFVNYGLLPERCLVDNPHRQTVQYDFAALRDYADKRRTELGNSQLYLIDAIVGHERRGSKLYEQWQNEGGQATNGMYPPANVQCLLRIYLNAALSDLLKNYITVYFLIDVCSTKDLDANVANRMCNFAIEFDVENVMLNTLCRASWLLDHDMFKEAMEILSSDKDWAALTKDKSWRWFHWTVAKLLVFKGEYFWARFYTKLVDIDLTDVDDHKFYINLEIMNNQCFEALRHIRKRSAEEKPILLRYLFDRCKEIDKLRCLIELPWESHEEDALYVYLKSVPDAAKSMSMKMLFLLQRGRYSEAVEYNVSLTGTFYESTDDDDDLTIVVSSLVDGFDRDVPKKIVPRCLDGFSARNVYKKTDTVLKRLNSTSKSFNVLDKIRANTLKLSNSSRSLFRPKNDTNATKSLLFGNKCALKRLSSDDDHMNNEKRRRIDDHRDRLPCTPSVNRAPVYGERDLEILDTPLVVKTTPSPLVTGCYSSILKTSGSVNKRFLTTTGSDKYASKMTLRFSLPNEQRDTAVERVDPTKDDSHSLGTINNNNNNNNIVIVEQREIETNSEEDDAQTNSGDCCVVYDHQTNDCTTGGVPPSWPEEKPEIINDGGCDEQMDVTKDYTVVVQQHGSDIDVPSFTAPGDAVMMSSLLSTISIGPAHSLAAPEQSHPEFTAGGLHQTPEEPPSSSPKPLEQKQPCDTRSDTVATDYQSGDSVRLNAFGDQDQDAAISSNSSDSISDDDDSDSDQDTTRYGRFKYHGSAAATDENCGEEEEEEKYITTVELDRPTTSSYEPSPPQSDQDDEPLNYYSSEDESLNYSSEIEERDDWDEEQEQSVTPASEYTARRSDSVENEADQSCSQEVSESNTVEDVHDVVAPKTNPITVFSSFNLAHSNIGHRQKDDDDLPGTVKADVDDSDDCTTAATTLGEVESEETDDSQPTRMVVDEQQQPPNSFLFGQQRRAEDASDDNDKPVFLFGRVYASQSDTTASADCTTTSTCASSTTVTGDCASDCNTSETETFTIASTTASTVNTLVNAEETESQDTIPYGRVDDDDIRDIVELKSLPDDSTSDDDGGTITPHNARSRSSCSSVHSEEGQQQESSSFRSNSLQPESSTGGAEPPRIVENSSSEQNAASQQLSQPDAAETTNVDDMMVHDTSEPFVLLVNCDWQTTGGDSGGGGAVDEEPHDDLDGSLTKSCPLSSTMVETTEDDDVATKKRTRRRAASEDRQQPATMTTTLRSKRAKALTVCPCQLWPSTRERSSSSHGKNDHRRTATKKAKSSSSGGNTTKLRPRSAPIAELEREVAKYLSSKKSNGKGDSSSGSSSSGVVDHADVHKLTSSFVLLSKLPTTPVPETEQQEEPSKDSEKTAIQQPVDDDIFRLFADCSRQRRVSLSSMSKSHEDLVAGDKRAQPKRKRLRSKSLTHGEAQHEAKKRQPALEQIPEEDTSGGQRVMAVTTTASRPKSKFNFSAKRNAKKTHRQSLSCTDLKVPSDDDGESHRRSLSSTQLKQATAAVGKRPMMSSSSSSSAANVEKKPKLTASADTPITTTRYVLDDKLECESVKSITNSSNGSSASSRLMTTRSISRIHSSVESDQSAVEATDDDDENSRHDDNNSVHDEQRVHKQSKKKKPNK